MRLLVRNHSFGINVMDKSIMYQGMSLWINTDKSGLWINSLRDFPTVFPLFRLVYNLNEEGDIRK